jgi:trans-aconitate methyltransferase
MPDTMKTAGEGPAARRPSSSTTLPERDAAFDAGVFWRARMTAAPSLVGTGTSGAPIEWQRWMYRGKVRAQRELLARAGVSMSGRRVVNLGCGTGFFEDLWETWGAARADGIDLVPELVEELQRKYPRRAYLCADLSGAEAPDLGRFRGASVATMIDVAYHVVDDARLATTLDRLLPLVAPGGHFLFTDMLKSARPAVHVRFRALDEWEALLETRGFRVRHRVPVFVANNRVGRLVHAAPGLMGAVQHSADALLRRTVPLLANNWAVLATRASGASE